MLLYTGDQFLKHDTGQHPECARRLKTVQEELNSSGLLEQVTAVPVTAVQPAAVTRVHSAEMLNRTVTLATTGGGRLDEDTVVCPESPAVAELAAGCAVDAVRRVMAGEDTQALCLIRPPGHHATPTKAMGFCLLNNVAIAAVSAIEDCSAERVLIIDWDVHHGNGTQDIFYDDERVTFLSAHRHPFWPGTGLVSETGSGSGLGHTINLPLKFGISRKDYLDAVTRAMERAAAKSRPDLVLISAGFDAHAADPVGSLGLESEDFAELTSVAQQIAADHCRGRLVSLLEGGYNVRHLAESVAIHLQTLISTEKSTISG